MVDDFQTPVVAISHHYLFEFLWVFGSAPPIVSTFNLLTVFLQICLFSHWFYHIPQLHGTDPQTLLQNLSVCEINLAEPLAADEKMSFENFHQAHLNPIKQWDEWIAIIVLDGALRSNSIKQNHTRQNLLCASWTALISLDLFLF